MKLSFFKTRFIGYTLIVTVVGLFLFNFLLTRQSRIMYKYFIEKPAAYNLERAERIASSIYDSFRSEIKTFNLKEIKKFVQKYNDIPFLKVNFIYYGENGAIHDMLGEENKINVLEAEYIYPIKSGPRELGDLLVYDINKEYEKGLTEYNGMLNIMRIFFIVFLVLLLSLVFYREYSEGLEFKKKEAEYRASHDGLTGLFTQKYFKEFLEKEIQKAQRYDKALGLIMCDVDFFKKFNDNFGHLAGDKVLKLVAAIIGESVRGSDIVARYGGEEFAIILTSDAKEYEEVEINRRALEIAKRITKKIRKKKLSFNKEQTNVTMSMGITSFSGEADVKPEHLISEADLALYESKNNGRDRINVYDPVTKEFIEYLS